MGCKSRMKGKVAQCVSIIGHIRAIALALAATEGKRACYLAKASSLHEFVEKDLWFPKLGGCLIGGPDSEGILLFEQVRVYSGVPYFS